MTTPKLLIDVSVRQVVTLTLNRPDSANACDAEMLAMLAAALRRVAAEPSARVIVLRGAGRHFCGGADVRASRQDAVRSDDVAFADVCRLLDGLLKPTIAVVHGGCVGGGVGFAACCDVVIAADDAFFAVPEVRLGIAPGALALYFMRAMGSRSLRRYLLTGERFSAQVAKQHGLVHIVQPASDIDAALADIVESLLLGAPVALGRA
jgi:methylglutaconyl-CoA hydratase